jgi:ABC-type uncharacterized transport system substrate-binding protein
MHRRHALLVVLASCVVPLGASAQQAGRMFRIAWLSSVSYATHPLWPEFIEGMKTLGWIEHRSFTIEHLNYHGDSAKLPGLAAEAVRRNVDLIVCAGTPPAAAAKNATTTIPIVFFFVGDPVGSGFVATLARPGGNVTGLGGLGVALYGKMLALLIEAVPKASRVAMLTNSMLPHHAVFAADAHSEAQRLNVRLIPVELRSPDEIDSAFETVAREKTQALLILGQPFLFSHSARVAQRTTEQRLPAIIPFEEVAKEGVLMSYGSRLLDDLKRLPHYADRILKGVKPAELPVEQPSRFYLTINLRTAKAIGVMIPSALLARAESLIE